MAIVIRLTLEDKIITWIVSEKFSRAVVMLSGFSIGIAIRLYLNRRKRLRLLADETAKSIPKGGIDLERVLEPGLVYEVIDKTLAAKIREILGGVVGNIIVDHRVAIFAGTLIYKSWKLAFGPKIEYVVPFAELVRYGWFGAGSLGAVFLIPSLASLFAIPGYALSGTVLGSAIFFTALFGAPPAYNHFISNSQQAIQRVVKPLPSVELKLSNKKSQTLYQYLDPTETVYVDPTETVPTSSLYLRNVDDEKIYVPKSWVKDIQIETEFEILTPKEPAEKPLCTHRESQIGSSRNERTIEKICDRPKIRKYVPLSQRTQTLDDIIKQNDPFTLKKTEPYLSQYNRKAQKFQKRRKAINESRLSNQQEVQEVLELPGQRLPTNKERIDAIINFE